jgi:nicotinate-nucleotide pyrophosphorylase (carboxylating)
MPENTANAATTWGPVEEAAARRLITLALAEDLTAPDGRRGDVTCKALVPEKLGGQAAWVARAPGVLAGLPVVSLVFAQLNPLVKVEPLIPEGAALAQGMPIARLRGPMRALLEGERTALNLLQRLSGVATLAKRYAEQIADLPCVVLDTRKTTPGWRVLEKYAVRTGGAANHRMGLADGILVKDNHLACLAGKMRADPATAQKAAQKAKEYAKAHPPLSVEVEVETLDQLRVVLPESPNVVLLDNMTPALVREAVALRNQMAPGVKLEASGGIRLENLREYALAGADRISVGAMTHQATALDMAIDFIPDVK